MQAERAAPMAVAGPGPGRAARRSQSRLTTIVVMLVTGAALLALAYVTNLPAASTPGLQRVDLIGTPKGPPPIVGQRAPDLTATALDGSTVTVSALKGKVVWLTFGATWCQPCRAENPDIQAAYDAFRDRGLVVVQMYMNEDAVTVSDYTERVGLNYIRVPDPDGRLSIEYRILGIPSHFFIDRDGVLRQLKVGTLSRDEMDRILTELAG
jgi:cytochrome c biogenesis protein CcmG/thiol:disulfide interchange protein DsbE